MYMIILQNNPQNTIEWEVTGSRVISDAQRSPTPLTIVTVEQLATTTPSNIPDALNKLPVFQGSTQPRQAGNGTVPGGLNVLNLRNFGTYRTLVLLDNHRVTPSLNDGTVDIDTLPQMLMSGVDVVTGGASAVYGSDAITGVVNFKLDKKFNGLKAEANTGLSTYGDGFSYKLGLAGGMNLFGGRAHIEGSLQHFSQDGVRMFDRPYGAAVYLMTGGGTAANPYTITTNTRRADSTFGGKISCPSTSACPQANGYRFDIGGAIVPFAAGTATGTGNQVSGGDSAYSPWNSATTNVRTNEAFGRFSYDVSSDTTFYLQTSAAEQFASGWWFPSKLTNSASYPAVFYKNNPYLSSAAQTALGNNGLNDSTNIFTVGEYINMGPYNLVGTRNINRNMSLTSGFEGTFGNDFTWDLFYTHGEDRLAVDNLNNTNYQKMYAAEDAVMSGGATKCYAATQAATAAAYADCVPVNPFGQGSITDAAYKYFTATTWYHMTNILDDLGGSFSGTAFDGWAGPVKFAISGELRFNEYRVDSNASPTATVNCTGLRNCTSSLALWAQNVVAPVHASNRVWEVAGELEVPLVKDVPFVQDLSANLAGRYTDYSTSGAVQTWKVGLAYQVNDQVRFRGTTSVDIRAPQLNDLFSPVQRATTNFPDLHTGVNGTLYQVQTGNPGLVPEVSRTYTAGVVVTPDFVPGFNASLDYYKIRMKNAIATISPGATPVQQACESSGGASQFCSLMVRPYAFSNTTAANYPTQILVEELNAALAEAEGFDFEANYAFEMSDLVKDWKGSWSTRLMANYQPVNQTQNYPGAAMNYLATGTGFNQYWKVYAKTHITFFLNYTVNDWTFALQNRFIGPGNKITAPGQIYLQPHVNSEDYTDINIQKDFAISGVDVSAYFTVQNLFNSKGALYPITGSIGIYYPAAPETDIMGRYFTIGVRAKL